MSLLVTGSPGRGRDYRCFRLQQVAAEGRHAEYADDDAPDHEEEPAGIRKKGIAQHHFIILGWREAACERASRQL